MHPVTGAIINPQFGNALPNRSDIPWVPCRKTLDPDLDARSRMNVAQPVKPFGISLRLANLMHYLL